LGAEIFFTEMTGGTPEEAFRRAVEEARYAFGHSGYTGTIAEKQSFVEIDLPEGMEPYRFASSLIDSSDPRVDDKWGHAGCINISRARPENTYLFFGWASW
jgi:hypothetical protein